MILTHYIVAACFVSYFLRTYCCRVLSPCMDRTARNLGISLPRLGMLFRKDCCDGVHWSREPWVDWEIALVGSWGGALSRSWD